MMIDFLSNKENYILRGSESPHLNKKNNIEPKYIKDFYNNIEQNLIKRKKNNNSTFIKYLDNKENYQEKNWKKYSLKLVLKLRNKNLLKKQ